MTDELTREYDVPLANMHCPSCVATITTLLTSAPVSLPEAGISISLLTGLVELDHPNLFDLQVAIRTLKEAGFDLGQPDEKELRTSTGDAGQKRWFESRKSRTKRVEKEAKEEQRRAEAHLASCNACQEWNAGQGKGKAKECAVTMAPARVRTELLIEGMTCSSCVGTVARTLSKDEDERIITSTVTLVPGRAIVEHFDSLSGEDMLRMLEDGGYDGEVIRSEKLSEPDESNNWTETRVAIEGMTCAYARPSLSSLSTRGPYSCCI
jgi:copper chaperone CopZ